MFKINKKPSFRGLSSLEQFQLFRILRLLVVFFKFRRLHSDIRQISVVTNAVSRIDNIAPNSLVATLLVAWLILLVYDIKNLLDSLDGASVSFPLRHNLFKWFHINNNRLLLYYPAAAVAHRTGVLVQTI